MLDSHPSMAIPYEARVAWGMTRQPSRYEGKSFAVDRFAKDVVGRTGFGRWGLDEDEIRDALVVAQATNCADAVRTVYRTYARSKGKERYGEKTPSNALLISDLAAVFPESRFIHIVRDGRNAALSIHDAWWWKRSLAEALLTWKDTVEGGREQGSPLGPGRYQEIRYEDLVRDTEPTLKRLCEFIELDYDPVMLRYYERADDLINEQDEPAEFANLQKPPTEGVRDWRSVMTEREVEIADVAAGDLLAAFGYERGAGRKGFRATVEVAATRVRVKARTAYSILRRGARRTARLIAR
jgi:hypothetical protein